nr:DNA methyltransferase [Rubellimicrobium sp. CFH 75288]
MYYGDNLEVLRKHIADESVDLIYLDPPFNSDATYNLVIRDPSGQGSGANIEAFEDTWTWGEAAEAAFQSVRASGHQRAATMLTAMREGLGTSDLMAYLAMMAVRLIELHRVLKPTGSLYLHCDPTASHYLKVILDGVFGAENFVSEIVWKRTHAHGSAKRYGPVHDTILMYAKTSSFVWTNPRGPHDERYLTKHFTSFDTNRGENFQPISLTGAGIRNGDSGLPWRGVNPTTVGRHWALPRRILELEGINGGTTQEKLDALDAAGRIAWPTKGGTPRLKWLVSDLDGVAMSDVWVDISPLSANAQERLGYPTQKPLALLERIIAASSHPGDLVLDPFCGCGTTVHAAEKLGRRWIGIDITHLAIGLIRKRLADAWRGQPVQPVYQVHGEPADLASARQWFQDDSRDKKQWELWALSLLGDAKPWQGAKKGADGGRDGIVPFGPTQKAIVSVKGGGVSVKDVRELLNVVERDKAQVGILLTLEPPTKPMLTEAAGAGHYTLDGWPPVPKCQIVTIEEAMALRDRAIRLPARRGDSFKPAPREKVRPAERDLFSDDGSA